MIQFRNVGIIGRLGSQQVIDTVFRLKQFLSEKNLHVMLEESIAEAISEHDMQVASYSLMGESCDLAIVVGGDGSVLGAARELAPYNIPLLGINRGNLGFLTDIKPDELETQITEVLEGRYIVEERFLLTAQSYRNDQSTGCADALNDVVLHAGQSARMIEFEIFLDGQFISSQRADGLIISTPTGSTAYALSAGGPIMHPKLDAIVVVPMYPHTLSSRPIVVDARSELKIVISPNIDIHPQVSCDAQNHLYCAPGDVITVSKNRHKVKLLHLLGYNYYEICRNKLGWGSRLGREHD